MNDAATLRPVATAPTTRTGARHEGLRRRVVRRFLSGFFRRTGTTLCPRGGLPASGIHRVLVCRPNHRLGNTVLISPLLREIETLYPGAEIDIVGAGPAAETLYGNRFHVRRVVSLPRRMARHLLATLGLLRQLRHERYDLAIDACLDSASGRLLLGLCQARYKVGFDASDRAEAAPNCPDHLAKRAVYLLRRAYGGARPAEWPPLNIELTAQELHRGRRALEGILGHPIRTGGKPPVIGLFANATGNKRYPEAWWSAFTQGLLLLRPDIEVVNVVADHGNSQLPGLDVSFYSRDLRKLAAVLACLDAFISADCGVMHLAAATGTPTLGLFSRDNSAKYAPYHGANASLYTGRDMEPVEAARRAADWLRSASIAPTTARDGLRA